MPQVSRLVHSLPAESALDSWHLPPNVWAVLGGDSVAFIDAGFSDEEAVQGRLEYWRRELGGRTLTYVLLTHHHYDHTGGADAFRRATGARIAAHEQEAPLIRQPDEAEPDDTGIPGEERGATRQRVQRWRWEAAKAVPDQLLKEGDVIPVGGSTLRVVHTPGHTPGSICFLLEEEKALFTGDMVLGLGTVAVSPPPYGDMAAYVRSLHRMKALGAEIIYPGHGPVVPDAGWKLQELIDHRREREEQILRLLRQGKSNVAALVRSIYPELDRRILGMATGQVLAHLHKLEKEGLVTLEGRGQETRITLQV